MKNRPGTYLIGPKWRFWGKKFLGISPKKFGSAYAQSPWKCSNIEILAKIEGKEAKFFSKIYEGHIRIWFRSNKNSKLSHACVPLKCDQKEWAHYVDQLQYIQQHGLMIFNNMMKKNIQDYMYKTHGLMIFNYMMRKNIQDYMYKTHGRLWYFSIKINPVFCIIVWKFKYVSLVLNINIQ